MHLHMQHTQAYSGSQVLTCTWRHTCTQRHCPPPQTHTCTAEKLPIYCLSQVTVVQKQHSVGLCRQDSCEGQSRAVWTSVSCACYLHLPQQPRIGCMGTSRKPLHGPHPCSGQPQNIDPWRSPHQAPTAIEVLQRYIDDRWVDR